MPCASVLPGFVAGLARLGERHVGIGTQRQQLFFAGVAVLEAPPAATRRREQQVQAALVRELGRLLRRLRLANQRVGEHLGVTPPGGRTGTPIDTPKWG